MAYPLWRRILAAAANQKLPDPPAPPPPSLRPAVTRVLELLDDREKWERQYSAFVGGLSHLVGPCDITITVGRDSNSYRHVELIVNKERFPLDRGETVVLREAVEEWLRWKRESDLEKVNHWNAGAVSRIDAHLANCKCDA